jgi:hypothetical protein
MVHRHTMGRLGRLGGLVLAAALAACGGGGDVAAPVPPAPPPVQQQVRLLSVHIFDKGNQVVPGTSVTDFAPGKLSYTLTSAPSIYGDVKFDAALANEDFERLAALVESARLTTTLGEPSSYDAPCRHFGYEIEIKRSDAAYQFSIPGTQVCGLAARAGLFDLLRLRDELVAKYKPKTGA